jgi:hypothetical protein
MKSSKHGKRFSGVEVQGLLRDGVWMLIQGREYFLPFDRYPWFKTASAAAVQRVQLLHGRHLHWPELDVDLSVESLERPERYPLAYR